MTIARRALAAGEADHERIWVLVGLAALALVGGASAEGLTSALVCPWKAMLGWPCVTCGAMRALQALGAGAVPTAFRLNPLVTAGTLLWAVWAVQATVVLACGLQRWRVTWSKRDLTAARWTMAVAVAASWVSLVIDGR